MRGFLDLLILINFIGALLLAHILMTFKFLLLLLYPLKPTQLLPVHKRLDLVPEVTIEQIKVYVHRVRDASAEVGLATNFQPVSHCKIDSLRDIKAKVEALVVRGCARHDE